MATEGETVKTGGTKESEASGAAAQSQGEEWKPFTDAG